MSRMLTRLGRESGGQALSEYGIILALVAGLHRLEAFAGGALDDPRVLWGAGIVFVLVVLSWRRR